LKTGDTILIQKTWKSDENHLNYGMNSMKTGGKHFDGIARPLSGNSEQRAVLAVKRGLKCLQ
jgi:hypothetical protein